MQSPCVPMTQTLIARAVCRLEEIGVRPRVRLYSSGSAFLANMLPSIGFQYDRDNKDGVS